MNHSIHSRSRPFALARQVVVVTVVALAAFLVGTAPASALNISVNPGSLTDHGCDETEWGFIINQIVGGEAKAPPSIQVTWDGVTENVDLSFFSGSDQSGTAHYVTTEHLDLTVTAATAVIYDGWVGQFNLSHGPCGPPEETTTTTTTVTPPPGEVTTPATAAKPPAPSAPAAPAARAPAAVAAAPRVTG
jgi:hypothetical protein